MEEQIVLNAGMIQIADEEGAYLLYTVIFQNSGSSAILQQGLRFSGSLIHYIGSRSAQK